MEVAFFLICFQPLDQVLLFFFNQKIASCFDKETPTIIPSWTLISYQIKGVWLSRKSPFHLDFQKDFHWIFLKIARLLFHSYLFRFGWEHILFLIKLQEEVESNLVWTPSMFQKIKACNWSKKVLGQVVHEVLVDLSYVNPCTQWLFFIVDIYIYIFFLIIGRLMVFFIYLLGDFLCNIWCHCLIFFSHILLFDLFPIINIICYLIMNAEW